MVSLSLRRWTIVSLPHCDSLVEQAGRTGAAASWKETGPSCRTRAGACESRHMSPGYISRPKASRQTWRSDQASNINMPKIQSESLRPGRAARQQGDNVTVAIRTPCQLTHDLHRCCRSELIHTLDDVARFHAHGGGPGSRRYPIDQYTERVRTAIAAVVRAGHRCEMQTNTRRLNLSNAGRAGQHVTARCPDVRSRYTPNHRILPHSNEIGAPKGWVTTKRRTDAAVSSDWPSAPEIISLGWMLAAAVGPLGVTSVTIAPLVSRRPKIVASGGVKV